MVLRRCLPPAGEVLFNLEMGGYFSAKRNVMSSSYDCSLTEDQLVPFTIALLEVFRWAPAWGGLSLEGPLAHTWKRLQQTILLRS